MKLWPWFFALIPFSAFAQAPASPPPANDPKVIVPVSLLQALVNAGQDSPGKIINPLTDQVRTLVNEQLGQKQTAQAASPPPPQQGSSTEQYPPQPVVPPPPPPPPPQTPQGAPVHKPLPEPEKK